MSTAAIDTALAANTTPRRPAPVVVNALEPRPGTAVDPLVETVCWRAWRLDSIAPAGAQPESPAVTARNAFGVLTEQLWIPGRNALVATATVDPVAAGTVDVGLAVGVLGSAGEVAAEAGAVDVLVETQLGAGATAYSIRSTIAADLLALPRHDLHTCLIRQKMIGVDNGEGGEITLPLRFNPTFNPWFAALRLLAPSHHWFQLRVTVLPTELTVDDQQRLDAAIRSAIKLRTLGAERPEAAARTERVWTTLIDTAASFGSPLLCGELALISDAPIPERLARAVACCFTSETDVLRRHGYTTVAAQPILFGGFQLDWDPPRHLDALRAGLPLYGGVVGRGLQDVWTIRESPFGWPLPTSTPVPGVRVAANQRPLAPVDCTSGVLLGWDVAGNELRVPETSMRLHVSIVGRSGCGKSALQTGMAEADLRARQAFLFIDPDGPAADRLVAQAAHSNRPMVVIDVMDGASDRIEFASLLQPDGSNLFSVERAVRRFADAIVSPLPAEWAGPRFSLSASAQLLPACAHGLEVADVFEMLSDESKVRALLDHPAMPGWVREQLLGQFARSNNDAASVRDWTTSKFAPFFTGPARRLLAAPGRGIDIGEALLAGIPVVANLAGLPRADARIVGHLVLSMAIDAIVDRGATEPDDPPIRIYVDEAPRFPVHNLELLLTGGRKFGAALVLACQNVNQYGAMLADLVLGAEVQVAFAQNPRGAIGLADQLELAAADLIHQPDHHAFVRVGQRPVCSLDTLRYTPCPRRPPRRSLHPSAVADGLPHH